MSTGSITSMYYTLSRVDRVAERQPQAQISPWPKARGVPGQMVNTYSSINMVTNTYDNVNKVTNTYSTFNMVTISTWTLDSGSNGTS